MTDFPLSLGIRSNPTRRGFEGNAVITNGYAEHVDQEGKSQVVLYAHSGFQAFATLTGADGGVKAMLDLDGVLKVVAGTKLYSVTAAGAVTVVGTLTGASGMVTMAANRRSPNRQIAIVSNSLWWILENGVLTAAPDADLAAPNSVCEIDGYFVFTHSDGQFTSSGNNASSIDPLEFARAESNADGLLRGMRRGKELVLLGGFSTEFWSDVGGADFAFSPLETIEMGCYAAMSACDVTWAKEGQQAIPSLAMCGSDNKGNFIGVVLLQGMQPIKISTAAVDRVIAAEVTPSSITGDFRVQDGHPFYTLSGTDWTWECDLSTGAWNPRKSAAASRWRVRGMIKVGGKSIYGDYSSGVLYQALPTLFTEATETITWEVQPPPLSAAPYDLSVNAVFLDVIPASGLTFSTSHTIAVSYSINGGSTFSTARNSIIGATGRPLTKIVERNFGVMPQTGVTFKFSMPAAKVNGLVGAMVNADRLMVAA